MRTRFPHLATTVALCTFTVAILSINAGNDESQQGEFEVICYPIHDLPVYTLNDKRLEFNPKVLVTLIESKVDPLSWGKEFGVIRPSEKNISLVIRQTKANHQRIADLLSGFRNPHDPREEVEIKPPKLKLSQHSPNSIVPPDPVLEQLKQQPPRQLLNIPLDVELLTDQFVHRSGRWNPQPASLPSRYRDDWPYPHFPKPAPPMLIAE